MPGQPKTRARRRKAIEKARELQAEAVVLPQKEKNAGGMEIDWTAIRPAELIPYQLPLDPGDAGGEYRRQRMDQVLLGVMRFGKVALGAICARLAAGTDDQIGYAIPTIQLWIAENVDTFADRVETAHTVFTGRLVTSLIDRADQPFVPRDEFVNFTPLMAALNAFIPEHFKRGTVQVNAENLEVNNISKRLVLVGENLIEEQKQLAAGGEM